MKTVKVSFLGDSITEGVGASSADTRYTAVFEKLSGYTVKNYGISGTRIARNHNPSPNPRNDNPFIDRVEEIDKDTDIVVVFGGTNDFGHGDGGLGHFYSDDEHTFYGALHLLIRRLTEHLPSARIVFMTPLHRISERTAINEYGYPTSPLWAYCDAIREVCEYYSVPVLDLFRISGIQPSLEIHRKKYMPDGLHPSDDGARIIASLLLKFLNTL